MSFKHLSGFTLIELMMVVAILAIVAVFAVSHSLQTVADARKCAALSDLQTLRDGFLAEDGYLQDMVGIPGFSCGYLRVANLLMPTNLYGRVAGKVIVNRAIDLIRLDDPLRTRYQCESEGCALPQVFTAWNEVQKRGWHGPYVKVSYGVFPNADEVRFANDLSFEDRGFFPAMDNFCWPVAFLDKRTASVYGFVGEPAVIDPWGNPYVLQIPPAQAFQVGGITNVSDTVRFGYARLVSAGENGVLETPCFPANTTMWNLSGWDERTRRLVRQAGLIDGTNTISRGDDIVVFLKRNDLDEQEEN